jgi:hypothetical protein
MTDWWAGLAPAQTTVSCAGAEHQVRWEAGGLVAVDHDDAEGERALAALGGERCACVDLLDAWERHRADLRVLTLGSRGPADLLNLGEGRSGMGAGAMRRGGSAPRPVTTATATARIIASGPPWVSPSPLHGRAGAPPGLAGPRPIRAGLRSVMRSPPATRGRGGGTPDDEVIGLLALTGGLPARLQASVAAAWAGRLGAGDEQERGSRPQLEAALYGRVAVAVRSWLGRGDLELDLVMTDAATPPVVTWSGRDRLRAELPFAWLVDVWSRGLSSVMGRFCLGASSADGIEWTLSTVGPELGETETLTVRLPGRRGDGR